MLSASAGEQALLHSARYDVHARLTVGGVLLSSLLGYDPILSATWSGDVDNRVVTGTITVHRGDDGDSLAPLMSGSPFNAGGPRLYPGETFWLEAATVAKGATPAGPDWKSLWTGRIRSVDWAGDVVLGCVDKMSDYIDRQIVYGTNGGFLSPAAVQSQAIDNLIETVTGSGPPGPPFGVLETAVILGSPSGLTVREYWQPPGSLGEAVGRIALLTGWDLRQRPVASGTNGWRLALSPPLRTLPGGSDVHFAMGPSEYIDVRNLSVDMNDVRNQIEVFYPPDRARWSEVDPFSINRYGPRYILISEDQSSGINTAGEAQTMALGALRDLKDPIAEQEIDRFFFWPIEVGDKYRFLANGIHYDTNFDWAVTGYTHTLGPDQQRTSIRVRGDVAAAFTEWRRLKQRMTHVALTLPAGVAPEGATWWPVADLTPPAP